jgi:hypothetical protein
MLKRKGTLYEEFWGMIIVSGPNGTNFVGLLITLQVPLANVTKVKVKKHGYSSSEDKGKEKKRW